jgi:peptidoglycan/xylan/chitin deacetylase (PgdA/CDA1 family)
MPDSYATTARRLPFLAWRAPSRLADEVDSRMTLKTAIKTLIYRSGLLPAWHHWRTRFTLTVAMFHRVLPRGSSRWEQPEPEYTVSDRLFGECLEFFRRYYTVVSLNDVLAARRGLRPLPSHALLITFDDGWLDNLEVALPSLQRAGLPAVVFAATDPIADPAPSWWQHTLVRCLWQKRVSHEDLWQLATGPGRPPEAVPPNDLHRLLMRFAALDSQTRRELLDRFTRGNDESQRVMLAPSQLAELSAAGVAIGSHGAAHLPLSLLADPEADLKRSRHALAEWLPAGHEGLNCIAFPYGRYDAATLTAARGCGFALMFTTDSCINDSPAGRPASDVLGRIGITEPEITGPDGRLQPEKLAVRLFARPIERLDEPSGGARTVS